MVIVGIVIGMGVVLKNPPADKASAIKIEQLQAENDAFKNAIKDNMVKNEQLKSENESLQQVIKKNSEESKLPSPLVIQNGFVIR